MVQLLLQCGADVNAMDSCRNTPLHLAVFLDLQSIDVAILHLLCDAGAHLDYANDSGQTALDLVVHLSTRNFLEKRNRISLKCLCARFIRLKSVPYHGKLSSSLTDFIQRH